MTRDGDARLIARSVRGLEWVTAAEVSDRIPGAVAVTPDVREVRFRLAGVTPELLRLRTVDDVFLEVGEVGDVGATKDVPPALARRVARLDWAGALVRLATLRTLPPRPRFDVVASLEGRRNFNRFAVENTIGPALAPLLAAEHLPRTEGSRPAEPDLTVRVFVRGTTALVALRLAERPLHRRAWKLDTGPGTLHPPLAAAITLLAAPRDGGRVLDPFCGDGTIAVEAALAFPGARIAGSDIDPARLANARSNAGRAGVQVALSRQDAGELAAAEPWAEAILTNPPWNLAVDAQGLLARSLDRFWRRAHAALLPDGRLCAVTDAALDAPARLRELGLHPAVATQIRLAGRVSHVVLAGAAQDGSDPLPPHLADWRRRAVAAGVVTADGF